MNFSFISTLVAVQAPKGQNCCTLLARKLHILTYGSATSHRSPE